MSIPVALPVAVRITRPGQKPDWDGWHDYDKTMDKESLEKAGYLVEYAYAAPVGSQQSGSGEATVVDTVLTRSDLIGIAKLALIEMEKISKIFDDAIAKCEAQNSPPAIGVTPAMVKAINVYLRGMRLIDAYNMHYESDGGWQGMPMPEDLADQLDAALAASSDTQAQAVSGAIRKALCKCGALVEEKDVDEHCNTHRKESK